MTCSESELSGRSGSFPISLSRVCDSETLRRYSKRIPLCIAPSSIDSRNIISLTLLTVSFASNPLEYIFGAPLAYRLRVRLVLARRQGKLPREKMQQDYLMCYASDKSLEI